MTVEKAKEFLVELADNDEVTARIEAAYFAALKSIAGDLGYALTDDDLTNALLEMSDLGYDDLDDAPGGPHDD